MASVFDELGKDREQIGEVNSTPDIELPEYLRAADNHNIAGQNGFSITDPDSWGEKIDNISSFTQAAVVSGVSGIYNSAVSIGNFFGAEATEMDVQTVLTDYDDDIGKYYSENKEAVDLVGFIGTSLVPGTLGVKALNAAKSGLVGENIARATRLLSPNTDKLIKTAAGEMAQSKALFSTLNGSTLKAFGSGFAEAAAESFVFEAAVTATMFKSPVLEDQDLSDIAANVLVGGAVGTVIGGAFNAAKIYSGIKKTISGADEALKPITARTVMPSSFGASDNLIANVYDAERVTSAQVVSDTLLADTISRARADTIASINLDVRKNMQKLAVNEDAELANTLGDNVLGMKPREVEANFFAAQEVGRLSTPLKTEKVLSKLAKKESVQLAEQTGAASVSKSLAYVKLTGEGAGETFQVAPKIVNLADTVKNQDELFRLVKSKKFSENKPWSAKGANHLDAEARYIWADSYAVIKDGMKLAEDDLPLLEKTLEFFSKKQKGSQALENPKFNIQVGDFSINNLGDLRNYIIKTKDEIATTLIKTKRAGGAVEIDEIAKITNMKKSLLTGTKGDETADYFARQSENAAYTKSMIEKGLWKPAQGEIKLYTKPTWAKIGYDTDKFNQIDGMVTEGMTAIQAKYRVYMEGVDRAISSAVGDEKLYEQIISISDRDVLTANRYGAQSGLFSFANSNYDSLGSKVQYLGSVTARLENEFIERTLEATNSVGLALISKPQAAIEFAVINQKISNTSVHYVLDQTGKKLIPRELKKYLDEIAQGKTNVKIPQLPKGTLSEIAIENPETLQAVKTHIKVNGERYAKEKTLRAAQGLTNDVSTSSFYPIRKNYNDYKHFAFVVDDKIGETGHVSMIHAATPEALEGLIAKVPNEFRVVTKSKSEDFHKAQGDYDYARTLNENYIDVSLKRAGVDSDFFIQTDPQKIVNTWIDDQTRRDKVLAKELVRAKNEKQFLELEKLGEEYTGLEASQYATSLSRIQDTVKNPYANYIKTALNISTIGEHRLLVGFNNIMDKGFSNVVRALGSAFEKVKSPADLETLNQTLEKYGAKSGYYDAATVLLANHTAPQGELTKFVRGANSIIATLTLRTDPFNALNNAIGSNILLGAETSFISNAIKSSNTEAVGRLAELGKIKIPGTDKLINSPMKLIGEAYKDFISGDLDQIRAFYKENGWSARIVEQQRAMFEDLTLKGGESVAEMNKKLGAAFQKFKELGDVGESLTGNRLAEEMNRFVAARVASKYTDLAEQAGIFTREDSLATINTFVNRTQGNILASQRPLMFQGAVGSAVGLFQSYQFNIMQQLFRYIGEGSAKDTAMLLGLQGSIYGMNGLPAFNYINTHIVGTASGNTQHKDIYEATYGVAGKEAGDWLMYGVASNLLGSNIYTRGDLNPRQLSIIPVNPLDIPAVNAVGKVINLVSETFGKVVGGADIVETFVQGVEHNGFSRPLAGIAQVAQAFGNDGQVYSTDTSSNIIGSNDLLTLTSLKRLAGAKPLDEAIVNDGMFRIKAYQAKDRERMDALREKVKTSVIKGNVPTTNQYAEFAKAYASAGGKSKNFNRFIMEQYTNANTSGAKRLAEELSNPMAQNMQEIMRGREVTSITNPTNLFNQSSQ